VVMPPLSDHLDLASRIEARKTAWTAEDLAPLLEISPKSPLQDGQIGADSSDQNRRDDPVRSCANGGMAESQNDRYGISLEKSSMNHRGGPQMRSLH
jgi:hypothetical protein